MTYAHLYFTLFCFCCYFYCSVFLYPDYYFNSCVFYNYTLSTLSLEIKCEVSNKIINKF